MNHRKQERSVLARLVAAAIVLGVALLWTQPVGAASSGSLSGNVVAAADGTPLSGICVNVENGPGTVTDGKGAYSVSGLDAGTYRVQYSDCNVGPAFVTQWYAGRTDSGSADPVSVVDGTDTPLTDVALAAGVSVSGTVTDTDGNPLTGITVSIDPTGSGQGTSATTDADGTYATSPLASGDYKVQFSDNSADPLWAREYWKDAFSWNTADVLTLNPSDGPSHGGIDAQLAPAAQIRGTVTDPGSVAIPGICVDANVSNNGGWDYVNGATTAADGTYTISQLPATELRVYFHDCATGHYSDEWYDNSESFASSTPVALTAGEVRSGVDAQLAPGIAVSGTVTDTHGNPLAGINVWVDPTGQGSGAGGQTDIDGNYTTNRLSPGDYRVQFSANGPDPEWATQFWNGQHSWNRATVLTLSNADAPVRTGIDAVLSQAATVSGTVMNDHGAPAAGVCVDAVVETADGFDGIGNATSGPDGQYAITGLPPTPMKVVFRDCNHNGPYIDQWWNGRPDPSTADTITPVPGETTAGIDAHLEPAAEIRGHVSDTGGDPLEGICAQATSDGWVGGLAQTDQNGDYAITISRAGSYRVQFVDCTDSPEFAGQWWDHAPTAAAASIVTLVSGESVGGIDAELALGAVGTISGRIVNLQGDPMTTSCVVAYLPDRYARFAPVAPDGTYEITGVPSGTYALGALGCDGGDPSGVVADPDVPSVNYTALWWDAIPLHLDNTTEGGPDPIAQGATLVTVAPGEQLTDHDFCFGCTAIAISGVTPGSESLTVEFTTPGLANPNVQATAEDTREDALTYAATCASSTGGIGGSATGADPGSITVAGLTAGATYTCQVTASDNEIPVAASPSPRH